MAADFFPRFFDPVELGKSLKEVATDVIATTHVDIISRWFHSSKDADLFIWMDKENNILKQQLSYYGQVVEWNVVEGVKTGHIVTEESRSRSKSGSEILHFDDVPQQTSVQQAIVLLNHIIALKENERQDLVRNFTDDSTTMPPEIFIARFGEFAGEKVPQASAKPIGLLSRLKQIVRRVFR